MGQDGKAQYDMGSNSLQRTMGALSGGHAQLASTVGPQNATQELNKITSASLQQFNSSENKGPGKQSLGDIFQKNLGGGVTTQPIVETTPVVEDKTPPVEDNKG
jgi:hypothetical protein